MFDDEPSLFPNDVEAAIAQRGIEPSKREVYQNGVHKVLYRDLDGNEIGLGGASLR